MTPLRSVLIALLLPLTASGAEPGADVAVLVETVELGEGLTRKLDRKSLDAPGLRTLVDGWIAADQADWIDCTYLRAANLAQVELNSRLEVIYGTEGDPPEVPTEFATNGAKGRMAPSNSTFTAFESDFEGLWSEGEFWIRGAFREGEVLPEAVPVNPHDNERETVTLRGNLLTWSILKEKISLANDREDLLQKPMALKWQPNFVRLRVPNELTLDPGVPALVHAVPSPLDRRKIVLVFATTWILREVP